MDLYALARRIMCEASKAKLLKSPAVKDVLTGEVFENTCHLNAIIDGLRAYHPDWSWEDALDYIERHYEEVYHFFVEGFVTWKGQFVTRDEADKMAGVRDSEELATQAV